MQLTARRSYYPFERCGRFNEATPLSYHGRGYSEHARSVCALRVRVPLREFLDHTYGTYMV